MAFDTIYQTLITHTVYIYTISNWGNPKILGRLVWSMLVEVLFNVGMISVSTDRTDRPVGGWVFGTGFHGVPRSKFSCNAHMEIFLAMRIWRCMFRTPSLIHAI